MMLPEVDDVLICDKCRTGRLFVEKLIYSYKKHPKLKGSWVRIPTEVEVICRNCGNTVMKIPYETVQGVIKPRI